MRSGGDAHTTWHKPILVLAALCLVAGSEVRDTPTVRATAEAAPAVATVTTIGSAKNPLLPNRELLGSGSAVLVSSKGYLLTNAHVVEGARIVHVAFGSEANREARVLAALTDLDLAVLQIPAKDLPEPVKTGRSADIQLAETVIAVGNPYGLGKSVSVGVISNPSRQHEVRLGLQREYLQTDASINPGNSGGALVNLDGELIGINTARYAIGEGLGFAIPVDRALKVLLDIQNSGRVVGPWLGAEFSDVMWRRDQSGRAPGACRVGGVYPRGPAAAAGLQVGDIVHSLGELPVLSRADLNAQLAALPPDAALKLGVIRGSARMTVDLNARKLPEDAGQVAIRRLGAAFDAGASGLVAERVSSDGPWALAGLRAGDVLEAVDGRPVTTVAELAVVMASAVAAHRPWVTVRVRRKRHTVNRAIWLSAPGRLR